MMWQKKNKYTPLVFFLIMLLLGWAEEIIFVEGIFHHYLYEEQHYILRALIRITYAITLFLLGYKGLSYLQTLWVKQLWVGWYILVLVSSGIRMLPLLLFRYQIPSNIWSFLISIYALGLMPFPYLGIWLLWMVTLKSKE